MWRKTPAAHLVSQKVPHHISDGLCKELCYPIKANGSSKAGDAYRGCLAESLSCDRPRGHAEEGRACQHADESKAL